MKEDRISELQDLRTDFKKIYPIQTKEKKIDQKTNRQNSRVSETCRITRKPIFVSSELQNEKRKKNGTKGIFEEIVVENF